MEAAVSQNGSFDCEPLGDVYKRQVVFQKALYLPGLGVLRHEILLHLHKLPLDGLCLLYTSRCV